MLYIDEDALLKNVRAHASVREITLQAPEGLRITSLQIAHLLEEDGYTVFISTEPCYGACDPVEVGDLLVHLGHTPMLSTRIPALYVDVYDDFDFIPTLSHHLAEIPPSVGLLTTAQHRHRLSGIETFLQSRGITPMTGKGSRTAFDGQILGCDLSAATCIQESVEAFLYLGTGTFHPLGAAIATGKPVFRVYDTLEPVDPTLLLKQRHTLIFKASRGLTYGIVLSTKRGQFRKEEALYLQEYIKEKGKKAYLFITNEIRPEILHGCDAYIICACPRIALDDARRFRSPALTPCEVPLLFEDVPYEMDMIL
ncbi:MAG: diphthamide biosynthesis enzyme Dph2 [Theionarchaea archaeon]|nr:diphthamide biosynthesis enzyme Dph2 [Theionarchaea archaeon]